MARLPLLTSQFLRTTLRPQLSIAPSRPCLIPISKTCQSIHTTKPLKMSSLNEQLQLGNLFDVKGKVALVTGGGSLKTSILGPLINAD